MGRGLWVEGGGLWVKVEGFVGGRWGVKVEGEGEGYGWRVSVGDHTLGDIGIITVSA